MKEITDYFRRSDSLYHSTLGRRDLCDMVARMESERGTCGDVYPDAAHCFTCSECGHQRIIVMGWDTLKDCAADKFNYCPNCGRKVVDA